MVKGSAKTLGKFTPLLILVTVLPHVVTSFRSASIEPPAKLNGSMADGTTIGGGS
jgi:hypothetical protein